MDLISAYTFGIRNSTNFLQDKPYRDHWLHLYLCRHRHHFWPQELPSLASLCSKLGFRLYPVSVDRANEELRPAEDEAVVYKAIHAGIDREENLEGDSSVLYSTTVRQRDLSIASEILDQVLAGHETAGIVLTYLAWCLSQRQGLQDQLREELLTLNSKELDGLPLLHAVVMETLRLHAPIPGPQPRMTPYPCCKIGGYIIPGGVRIAALAHTLHLDDKVYPDPEHWDHKRWLDQTEQRRRDMNRQFWAFGSGGRMCIGSNFATNEMKHIVAMIYSNFKTSVVNDDGMEQIDGYSARPAGEQLFLKFTAL
ncbi:cytochrome p450 domain-containing protein [Hirsutella rhossiliensis]|uniref:Cytochrome p450 domain-containing protein n=1 Tax=Hirsutella rhossiliensis TaxID=111463 RepID=A0A9P8SEY7_9HYPO|nr:cytochrome p450 domain-containing protein [Hirsutella rhossiliensis]KAH0959524.1 cytochrome p450 domain-containing protein [Hirsutella rhossiliensis]